MQQHQSSSKSAIRLWVCLLLTAAELSHEGIVKGLLQFWAISDFSASLTLDCTFCVHCAPHHLPLAKPRLSSSHASQVSLSNPKIKLRSGIISKSLGYMNHPSPIVFTQRLFCLLPCFSASFPAHLLSATNAKEPFRKLTPSPIHL